MVEPLMVVCYDGGTNGGLVEVCGSALAISSHDMLERTQIRRQDVLVEI